MENIGIAGIFVSNLDSMRGEPWFDGMMIYSTASVLLAITLCVLTSYLKRSVDNIVQIRNAVTPKPKQLKALAVAEEVANTELDALATDYGADRAAILLFHNGKVSLGGVHLLRASIKAEGSSGRFPRIASRVQDIPMLAYGRWTNMLITGVDVRLPDVSLVSHKEAPEIAIQLEQNSVKSLYAFPLLAPNGDIDGCVFVEYCRELRDLGSIEMTHIRARGQSIYTKLHEANNV